MNRKLLSLLACLTLVTFVLSCGSQNQHLSKGKELIKSNKRRKEERAALEFKKAVEQEPDNAEAQYLLGYYNSEREIDVETGDALGKLGINVKDDGVIVTQVQPRSPADLAGVEVEDVIKMVGAREIENETDYEEAINQALAKNMTIKLNLADRQVEVAVEKKEEGLGLVVKDNGAIVSEVQPQSPASLEHYIEAGDKIQTVDGKEIRDVADYEDAIKQAVNIRKTVRMNLKASKEMRGERMYLAYKNDRKKYLEILVNETLRDREQVVKEVRNSALDALKRIYKSGDRGKNDVLKYLMKAIKSKDNRDRYDAGWALAELGKDYPGTIVPKLIDLLDYKRMETRLNVVVALSEIGDKSAVAPLVKLINSGSEEKESDRETAEVRRLAVEALRKIGGENAVGELVKILENRGSSMRVDAIEGVSSIGDEEAVPSLLKVLGEKGSRQVSVTFK